MAQVFVIGSLPEYLVNFRGELIISMVLAGHNVTAMIVPTTPDQVQRIKSLGVSVHMYPVHRNGLNPWCDLQTLWALYKVFREYKPDVILAYTIKPVIWSGMAAFLTKGPQFYALIEGLGYAFQGGNWRRRLVGILAKYLYRFSLVRAAKVIFLNSDNKYYFLKNNIVMTSQVAMIDGIGVNLGWYSYQKLPTGNPVFLCIARLLGEKGLREYAHSARLVKQRYPEAVFRLLGPLDPSPDGIEQRELEVWQKHGVVEYLGVTSDVRSFIASCHVYVLPSYHEGIPRTVMEAMAMGRPILTTNVPGCRETVVSGKNGFLVPKANVEALAERLVWFIEHRAQWEDMGQASRLIAEERFDVHKINKDLLRIMNLNGKGGIS